MRTFADINSLRIKLETVEKAIEAAATGSSYSIGGRTLTRQNIPELRDERTRLMREIKRTQSALEGVRNPSSAVATWNP